MRNPVDSRQLMRQALAGHDLSLDSAVYSLHELTQIAVTVQAGARLAIRNAATMTPIERASIETAGSGRVLFV